VPAARRTDSPPGIPPAPALAHAALDLSARLLTLEAAARRVRRGEDGEAIHDFRVASRRLAAALDLWAPILDPDSARRARRRVRRMRRELSTARDLEVLAVLYRERMPEAPPETRIALETRLDRIERLLTRSARRAPDVVREGRLRRVRRGLLRAVRRAPLAAAGANAGDLAAARISATRARALDALREAWSRRDDPSLHEARVRVKAWRYAREIAGESLGEPATPAGAAVAELRTVQEALGTVQDLVVAAGDLAREARRARGREQPELARAFDSLADGVLAEKQRAAAEAQRRATTLSVAAVRGRAAGS